MTKLLMLSLAAVVLLSVSQAASSGPSSRDKFPPLGLAPDGDNNVSEDGNNGNMSYGDASDDNIDIVYGILDESEDDLADDQMVGEELTEEEKAMGKPIEFPVDEMDDEELKVYLELEEQIFVAQADEHVGFQVLKEQHAKAQGSHLRRKRALPFFAGIAFAVGRSLFSRYAYKGFTRGAKRRITRHYETKGNYLDAVRDFHRLKPSGVKPFKNGRVSGETGTMGPHKVTVRDWSSGPNNPPSLDIYSHGKKLVRKFRYHEK